MLRPFFLGLRSLLIPASCAGCRLPIEGERSEPLCPACMASLPVSLPLSRSQKGLPVVSPFLYEGIAREMALALKYRSRLRLAPFLGKKMAEAVSRQLGSDPADLVVPIPLHPTRLRERSFNQAELLAEVLAGELRLPCEAGLLARCRPTLPQTDLDRVEREANVQGAFVLQADGEQIRNRRLLLVDDVLTTGSTAQSCAGLLLQAGARSVTVVTAATAQ